MGVGLGLRGWFRRWCWFGWFGFYDVGAMRSVVVGEGSLKRISRYWAYPLTKIMEPSKTPTNGVYGCQSRTCLRYLRLVEDKKLIVHTSI